MTSNTQLSRTPVAVAKRDIDFGIDASLPRHWHGENAHITHFFNALSIFFPDGERMFIRAVMHFRDQITDPELRHEVNAFIGQEAMHGREHEAYNNALKAQGYRIGGMERFVHNDTKFVGKYVPQKGQLAITIGLEHITAILANQLLSHPEGLKAAAPEMQRLWRWHAVEETEHKAVAFDLYQAVAGGPVGYIRRCLSLLFSSFLFTLEVHVFHLLLLRQDKQIRNLRGWWAWFRFFWITPGPMRKMLPDWLRWFKPGFHPWQRDNRDLLDKWKAQYDTLAAEQS